MAFDHEASRRVAEKIGMKKEKEFLNSRNRNFLTYVYSISRNE
jgi:ribosomal-protein-alanine N-acetyltransferase